MKVPIGLIEWGIENPNTLRTLLYLKKYSPGYVRRAEFKQWADKLAISVRTLKRHLQILHDQEWVNITEKVVYLRSIDRIIKNENWKYKGKRRIKEEDFKDIKSWIFAGVVARLNKYVKKHRRSSLIKKVGESKKEYAPLAVRYIAKCLGVSTSAVQRLKTHAINAGAVSRMRNLVDISSDEEFAIKKEQQLAGVYLNLTYQGGRPALRRADLLLSS